VIQIGQAVRALWGIENGPSPLLWPVAYTIACTAVQAVTSRDQSINQSIKQFISSRVQITGCAVAQHCYNGDVSFLWEKWKL